MTDLRPVMLSAKRSASVYPKTDTHLSAMGGHFAYLALLRHPYCADLGLEPRPIGSFSLRIAERFRGDLADKEKVVLPEGGQAVCRAPGEPAEYSEVAVVLDWKRPLGELVSQDDIPSSHRPRGSKATFIYQRGERDDLPTAMVFGDSFLWQVLPYLRDHFRRLVFIWTQNPPFSVIELEAPDIVIHLMAERYLIRPPLMPAQRKMLPGD